jgi:outer membrane lipoprotein-sorting protein
MRSNSCRTGPDAEREAEEVTAKLQHSSSHHSNWLRGLLVAGLLCVVGAVLTPDVLSQAGNRAAEILRKAILARGEVSYSAETSVSFSRPDHPPRVLREIIYRKCGGRAQVKLLDPDGKLLKRTVSDGKAEWEHLAERGRVFQRPLPDPEQQRLRDLDTLDILARNFAVSVEGTDTVAGRKAYRIGIARRGGQPVLVRKLWIDQRNYIELKTERYTSDGRVGHVMSVQRINFSPRFQPGMFSFEPPENVKPWAAPTPEFVGVLAEAQRRAGFKAILPPQLPAGFALLDNSVSVHQHKSQPVLYLRYTNGLDSFSIFQRKADPDWHPPASDSGRQRRGVQTWVTRGFHFTLVGRLQPEDVETIRAGYR